MRITSTPQIKQNKPLANLPAPSTASAEAATSSPPSDAVDISYDKKGAEVERGKLLKKAKFGAVAGAGVGTALGVAAGVVGGIAGTLVGLAVAPALGIAGAVAGGVGGFMAVANRKNTHVGHLIGGLLAGAVGAAAGGMLGFYGGAALGAAAGSAGGALGGAAGAVGGLSIGGALGGVSVAGYELTSNKDQYPNLLAQMKEEEAAEAAQKKIDDAEQAKFEQELKQKLKDTIRNPSKFRESFDN